MKHTLALALVASLLAGCATQSSVVLRRGKIIERPAPSRPLPAPAPVKSTVAPAPAPVTVTVVAPVATPAPVAPAPEPAPVPVVTAPVVVAPAQPDPAAFKAPLVATRSGATVHLEWSLPPSASGYRAIEIMRNSQAQAAGRGRVRAVRAETTSLEDTLPDAAASYWYWLKLTHVDGTVQNLGPFAATSKS
jgi:hypothetical protein